MKRTSFLVLVIEEHNKLWKILKEMGISDLLTCLLRNLYSQSVRPLCWGGGEGVAISSETAAPASGVRPWVRARFSVLPPSRRTRPRAATARGPLGLRRGRPETEAVWDPKGKHGLSVQFACGPRGSAKGVCV